MKVLYGIKDPKIEKKETIVRYAEKNRLHTNNLYTYAFNSFVRHIREHTIPEVSIFDKDKSYIPYGDEYACNASAFHFIENLNRHQSYAKSETQTWENCTHGLTDLDGNALDSLSDPATDFYIFIFWAKFTGKLNKDHVRIWEEQALHNSNANLKVLKVNMDFQEFWGEENLNTLSAK